jgi:hypothetical protein
MLFYQLSHHQRNKIFKRILQKGAENKKKAEFILLLRRIEPISL